MFSLIQNAEKLGLFYKAYSLTQFNGVYEPNNVFKDAEDTCFHSLNSPANQWWQISFSDPVSINSYIIKARTSDSGYYQKSLFVNVSFDNETWKTVDDKTNQNTCSGETLFNLSTPINCKHFRIVLKVH